MDFEPLSSFSGGPTCEAPYSCKGCFGRLAFGVWSFISPGALWRKASSWRLCVGDGRRGSQYVFTILLRSKMALCLHGTSGYRYKRLCYLGVSKWTVERYPRRQQYLHKTQPHLFIPRGFIRVNLDLGSMA